MRDRIRGQAALLVLIVAFCAVVGPCIARGEPIRLQSPSSVVTDGGSELRLPAGVFLPEEDYERLDVELRRLQAQETRLKAQNESLKESLGVKWYVILGSFAAGAATAWYLK